jgi:hypothetical protein
MDRIDDKSITSYEVCYESRGENRCDAHYLIVMRAERKAFGENFSAQGPPIRRVELE